MTEDIEMHLSLRALERQTASNTGCTGTLWKETTALMWTSVLFCANSIFLTSHKHRFCQVPNLSRQIKIPVGIQISASRLLHHISEHKDLLSCNSK